MHVPLATLRRAMCLLDGLQEVDPVEAPHALLPGLAELVGCDALTYNEIEADNQLRRYADYPVGCRNPAQKPIFEAHLHDHPVLAHFREGDDWEAAKISDFMSRQEWHSTGLYTEFFGTLPAHTDDQIVFCLPTMTSNGLVVCIALDRAGKGFTEADRDVLDAIAGPVGNAIRRGRERKRAQEALDRVNGQLTQRERQILQLAAEGRTTVAIAHLIDASPRTVSKHFEHIYRKLGVSSRAAAVCASVR